MNSISHRKFIHVMAILAILMSALAPAVSQALSLATHGQGFVVEICTSNGLKMTQVIGDDESSSSTVMGSHCPYCVVQPLYLIPTITAFEFVAPQHYVAHTQSGYQSPQLLFAWLKLPSRAPPVIT
jgi:hypothetical protein